MKKYLIGLLLFKCFFCNNLILEYNKFSRDENRKRKKQKTFV